MAKIGKILSTLVAVWIMLLGISTPICAKEKCVVAIPVYGNSNDELVLQNKRTKEEQKIMIDQNGTATFLLSYDEPGDYTYTLTESQQQKSIDILVQVLENDDGSYSSSIIARDGKTKIEKIAFGRSNDTKAGSNNSGRKSKVHNFIKEISPDTSDNKQEMIGYAIAFVISVLGILIISFSGKERNEERNSKL